jgi:hypothetical protein
VAKDVAPLRAERDAYADLVTAALDAIRQQSIGAEDGKHHRHPFAHLYRTGRLRRVHLRGHANILKRVLVQAGACNLGLLLRTGSAWARRAPSKAVSRA